MEINYFHIISLSSLFMDYHYCALAMSPLYLWIIIFHIDKKSDGNDAVLKLDAFMCLRIEIISEDRILWVQEAFSYPLFPLCMSSEENILNSSRLT